MTMIIRMMTDKRHSPFGQVATVDGLGRPQVRTVHFRYTPDGRIGFGCSIKSPKWSQLRRYPFLASCYYDRRHKVQLRWEGRGRLIDWKIRKKKEQAIRTWLWRQVRPHIRFAYWRDYKNLKGLGILRSLPLFLQLNEPCPTFGCVLCEPSRWDILELLAGGLKARRTIHVWRNGKWLSRAVSPLHARDLNSPIGG